MGKENDIRYYIKRCNDVIDKMKANPPRGRWTDDVREAKRILDDIDAWTYGVIKPIADMLNYQEVQLLELLADKYDEVKYYATHT